MATVLLVEDSATQAVEITMLLEQSGHDVLHCPDGHQGLQTLSDHPVDVVITDMEMPEMNGLDLVQRMREDFAHVPAILVTSKGSEKLAADALRKGAASYVSKSDLDQLHATIEEVLGILRSDESYTKLIGTLTKNVFVFDLPNDPTLISPLVGLLMQVGSGMNLLSNLDLVRLGIAIEHAVLNAIFRGNLELPPDQTPDRHAAIYEGAKTDPMKQRLQEAPYMDRIVRVEAIASIQAIRIVIRDQGKGFDTSRLPEAGDPKLLLKEGGRGLVLMTSLVDQIFFNDAGNEVTLIKRATLPDA